MPSLPSKGDTIVEVLISIAIISSVLAGAFIVAQKSSHAVRDSQEHGEVLQYLQAQVEAVRALALQQTDDTSGVYSQPGGKKYFCIDSSNNPSYFPATFSLPSLDSDDFSAGSAYATAHCQFGTDSRYNIAITYDQAGKSFEFTGRWDKIGGGRSQEQLSYRVYPSYIPPTPTAAPPGTPDSSLDASLVRGSNPSPTPGPPGSEGGPISLPCHVKFSPMDPRCWTVHATNNTSATASVIRCDINWQDGEIDSSTTGAISCASGSVYTHHYTPQPLPQRYSVVLTNYAADGRNKTSNVIVYHLPF